MGTENQAADQRLSVWDNAFLSKVKGFFAKNREVISLVRYPAQGGNRDWYCFPNFGAFHNFLEGAQAAWSVEVYGNFPLLLQEKVTPDLLENLSEWLGEPEEGRAWLVYYPACRLPMAPIPQTRDWEFAENTKELKLLLSDRMGVDFWLFEEPDFRVDECVLAYVPDEEGRIIGLAY